MDNTKLKEILEKYENSKFSNPKDKEKMFGYVEKLMKKVESSKDVEMLSEMLDHLYTKFTTFDKKILFSPIEFLYALIDFDLMGTNINPEESFIIKENLKDFVLFKNKVLEYKQKMESFYNIKIILADEDISFDQTIFGKAISEIKMVISIKYLHKLLRKYPKKFIDNIKLEKIIVVRYFYTKDQYGKTKRLWWFETQRDNNVYLSYQSLMQSFDHEIYHQAMQYYDDMEDWLELRRSQDLFYIFENLHLEIEWFARNYGKENVSEDQATIAEDLMNNYKRLIKRSQNDDLLATKIDLVKKAYLILSEWVMNCDYFLYKPNYLEE